MSQTSADVCALNRDVPAPRDIQREAQPEPLQSEQTIRKQMTET